MKKLMLSLFIAFGFSACSLSGDDMNVNCGTYTDVAFTGFPLLCNYSVKSYPNNPAAILVTSTEKMESYFTKHENTCPTPSDPTINFSEKYLLAIFAGAKPTNGYSIKITSIIENSCEVVVNFYEKGPQAGETLTSSPTYPADFVLIPKTSKEIIFNKITESPDNIVIGSYAAKCTGSDCQKFFQINDFNIMKFQNVVAGSYDFNQYRYTTTTKRGEYALFLKGVPTEILNLKGQTKTYGTPDAADQGGIYFQLTQGSVVTKVFIDNNDTEDQNTELKLFKKAIQDKITSLK